MAALRLLPAVQWSHQHHQQHHQQQQQCTCAQATKRRPHCASCRVQSSSCIQRINLGGNLIGPQGTSVLCKALASPRCTLQVRVLRRAHARMSEAHLSLLRAVPTSPTATLACARGGGPMQSTRLSPAIDRHSHCCPCCPCPAVPVPQRQPAGRGWHDGHWEHAAVGGWRGRPCLHTWPATHAGLPTWARMRGHMHAHALPLRAPTPTTPARTPQGQHLPAHARHQQRGRRHQGPRVRVQRAGRGRRRGRAVQHHPAGAGRRRARHPCAAGARGEGARGRGRGARVFRAHGLPAPLLRVPLRALRCLAPSSERCLRPRPRGARARAHTHMHTHVLTPSPSQDTVILSLARMLASNTSLTSLGLSKHRMVDSQLETLVGGAGSSGGGWRGSRGGGGGRCGCMQPVSALPMRAPARPACCCTACPTAACPPPPHCPR